MQFVQWIHELAKANSIMSEPISRTARKFQALRSSNRNTGCCNNIAYQIGQNGNAKIGN